MSFDYDPYAVMTIVVRDDGTFCYLCDSCGGGWRQTFNPDDTLADIRQSFDTHIAKSHQYTREDTASWHKGI